MQPCRAGGAGAADCWRLSRLTWPVASKTPNKSPVTRKYTSMLESSPNFLSRSLVRWFYDAGERTPGGGEATEGGAMRACNSLVLRQFELYLTGPVFGGCKDHLGFRMSARVFIS